MDEIPRAGSARARGNLATVARDIDVLRAAEGHRPLRIRRVRVRRGARVRGVAARTEKVGARGQFRAPGGLAVVAESVGRADV